MTRDEIDKGIREDAAELALLKRDRKFLVDRAARFQEQLASADKALGRITGATCDLPDESKFSSESWPSFEDISKLCGDRTEIDKRIACLAGRLRNSGVEF